MPKGIKAVYKWFFFTKVYLFAQDYFGVAQCIKYTIKLTSNKTFSFKINA